MIDVSYMQATPQAATSSCETLAPTCASLEFSTLETGQLGTMPCSLQYRGFNLHGYEVAGNYMSPSDSGAT